jgi:hydroxymethylpyrimidine/phosphomethylpyrimidine kinase
MEVATNPMSTSTDTAPTLPIALTIAGSDSSGGAGIQADLRTFAALRVYGTSAITALTAQNTLGVHAVSSTSPEMLQAQVEAVLSDMPVSVVKLGMLGTRENVEVVVRALQVRELPVVVDPVLMSTSGRALLDDAGITVLLEQLIPLARVLTPNLAEAERLTGFAVRDVDDQVRAGRWLCARGALAVLVKGGHSAGDPVDVLVEQSGRVTRLPTTRIATRNTHGTGCTLASAIAAGLAHDVTGSLAGICAAAQSYVHQAILQGLVVGHGRGSLHHMHPHYARTGAPTPSPR